MTLCVICNASNTYGLYLHSVPSLLYHSADRSFQSNDYRSPQGDAFILSLLLTSGPWCQAIIWTNAGIFLIWPLGIIFSEISNRHQYILIQENAFQNVVREMAASLSRGNELTLKVDLNNRVIYCYTARVIHVTVWAWLCTNTSRYYWRHTMSPSKHTTFDYSCRENILINVNDRVYSQCSEFTEEAVMFSSVSPFWHWFLYILYEQLFIAGAVRLVPRSFCRTFPNPDYLASDRIPL